MLPLSILTILSFEFYPMRIFISAIPFRLLSVVGFLIILIGIVWLSCVALKVDKFGNFFEVSVKGFNYVLIILLVVLIIMTGLSSQNKRLSVLNYIADDVVSADKKYESLVILSQQIEMLTEKQSVIITNISEIKYLSNRATFGGNQFPFVDKFMAEWYERTLVLESVTDDIGLMSIRARYAPNVPVYSVININRKTDYHRLYCGYNLCLIKI